MPKNGGFLPPIDGLNHVGVYTITYSIVKAKSSHGVDFTLFGGLLQAIDGLLNQILFLIVAPVHSSTCKNSDMFCSPFRWA